MTPLLFFVLYLCLSLCFFDFLPFVIVSSVCVLWSEWLMSSSVHEIRMKRRPFSKGALRLAYFVEWPAGPAARRYVAKESISDSAEENGENFFLADLHTQLQAKNIADAFMVSTPIISAITITGTVGRCRQPAARLAVAAARGAGWGESESAAAV